MDYGCAGKSAQVATTAAMVCFQYACNKDLGDNGSSMNTMVAMAMVDNGSSIKINEQAFS